MHFDIEIESRHELICACERALTIHLFFKNFIECGSVHKFIEVWILLFNIFGLGFGFNKGFDELLKCSIWLNYLCWSGGFATGIWHGLFYFLDFLSLSFSNSTIHKSPLLGKILAWPPHRREDPHTLKPCYYFFISLKAL